MLGSILGGVGGGLVSGFFGYKGVKDTNNANRQIASARNVMEREEAMKARGFSMREAVKNRGFQSDEALKTREFQGKQVLQKMHYDERMSSTAVQRRMKDMRQAGINPVLAGKFESSSPAAAAGAGATASGSMPSTAKANAHGYTAKNKLGAAMDRMSTAIDLKQKIANIDNTNANTDLTTNKSEIIGPVSDLMEVISNLTDDLNTNAKSGYPKLKQSLKDLVTKHQPKKLNKAPKSAGNPLKRPLPVPKGTQRQIFKFQ